MCRRPGGEIETKSLTVKALDPFSPFISLASNIKHARVRGGEKKQQPKNPQLRSDTTASSLLRDRTSYLQENLHPIQMKA